MLNAETTATTRNHGEHEYSGTKAQSVENPVHAPVGRRSSAAPGIGRVAQVGMYPVDYIWTVADRQESVT